MPSFLRIMHVKAIDVASYNLEMSLELKLHYILSLSFIVDSRSSPVDSLHHCNGTRC